MLKKNKMSVCYDFPINKHKSLLICELTLYLQTLNQSDVRNSRNIWKAV